MLGLCSDFVTLRDRTGFFSLEYETSIGELPGARSQVRRPRFGSLVRNAVALVVSGGGSGLVGVIFWAVAAHHVSPRTIGRVSTEVAALVLIAAFAQSSFGTSFVRFLPVAGGQTRRFVATAYGISTCAAVLLATLYIALGLGHRFLPTPWTWRLLFVASVVAWTIFALQDAVLTGLRATRWVPVENISYGIVKLALIPAFVMVSISQGVFLAWIIPVPVVVLVVNWYLFRKRIPEHVAQNPSTGSLPTPRQMISLTGAQYATLLVSVATASIVSLVLIDRLGAVASAHYYLPAQIGGGAAIALWSLDRSFLVEASSEPDSLFRHLRVAIRAGIVFVTCAVVVGVVFASDILRIFGATYAATGTTLLRMLLLSLPGTAVTALYTSLAWIDRRIWKLAVRDFISAGVFFVLLFAFIGHYGILAVGIAALIQSGLQALFFLPLVVRRYKSLAASAAEAGTLGAAAAPVE